MEDDIAGDSCWLNFVSKKFVVALEGGILLPEI